MVRNQNFGVCCWLHCYKGACCFHHRQRRTREGFESVIPILWGAFVEFRERVLISLSRIFLGFPILRRITIPFKYVNSHDRRFLKKISVSHLTMIFTLLLADDHWQLLPKTNNQAIERSRRWRLFDLDFSVIWQLCVDLSLDQTYHSWKSERWKRVEGSV